MKYMPKSKLRKEFTHGSVVRIKLTIGRYGYGCLISPRFMWIYRFLTTAPASGDGFFAKSDWMLPVLTWSLPATFVDCAVGTMLPRGTASEIPLFYQVLSDEWQIGWKLTRPEAISEAGIGIRDATDEEIRNRFREVELSWDNYEELFQKWRPQMEIREVPEEFVDKAALLKESQEPEVEAESEEVELVIVFQDADTITDEPEEVFVEPLEEAVADAECGEVVASGTTPGVFEINVDTCRSDLRRCLTVIRRVLKKAGAPASTQIVQLGETEIVHPLEAPPKVARKKVVRKKRKRGDKER